MMDLVPYAVPVAVTTGCYLTSFRRTPWRALWASVSVGFVSIGLLIMAGVETTHHTTVGVLAGLMGACTLPLVSAFCNEVTAADGGGELQTWRKRYPGRAAKPEPKLEWTIKTVHDPYSDLVEVRVIRDKKSRLIGAADPVTELDDFMNLKTKAEDVAGTLNALGIQS